MISPIEEIIKEYKKGRMIILSDDENRENEGDLILPAEKATKEDINFMATHGRGLICLTLTQKRCHQLNLPLMVSNQATNIHSTNFTFSIDATKGISTGISAADRATTVRAAINPDARPEDLVQPGHIFPLQAQLGGVLTRAGHTEAGCDLARLAGFEPSSVIVEILNDDGSVARHKDLAEFSKKHNIKWGTIEDLIRYRSYNEKTIKKVAERPFVTNFTEFKLVAYHDYIQDEVHLALVKGEISPNREVTVRVHMEDTFSDILCEKGEGLVASDAMKQVACEEVGVFLLLRRQNKERILMASNTSSPHPWDDVKTYGVGAQILSDLGVKKMSLIGSPRKLQGLKGFNLEVMRYL